MVNTQVGIRRGASIEFGQLTELVFVALAAWLVAGAYLDAWDQLASGAGHRTLGSFQEVFVDGSWVCLTGFLVAVLLASRRRGLAVTRSLPVGYDVALLGCVVFAMGVLLDPYWVALFGRQTDIERLLAPTRLVSVLAGIVLVGVPFRAGLLRHAPVATFPMLLSASLVLSALTFATQFAHPFVDLLAATHSDIPPVSPAWVGEDMGVAALMLQSLLVVSFALVLIRSVGLAPGSLTLVMAVNGLFVAILKTHWEFVITAVATGAVADLAVQVWRPRIASPPAIRWFAAGVAAFYAAAYLLVLAVAIGTRWSPTLLVGSIGLCALFAWVASYAIAPLTSTATSRALASSSIISAADVDAALRHLHDPRALSASKLADLPCIGGLPDQAGLELARVLRQVISELASSPSPRDAESGRILMDYYVKRIGSHEIVMDPMHMSKQTYFRRLDKGKALVAERLDELSEAAEAST